MKQNPIESKMKFSTNASIAMDIQQSFNVSFMTENMVHRNIEYANDIYRAILTPIIVLLGIFGNIIIIIILSRQFAGRFEIYCFTLAVVQSFALIFNSFLDDFLGRGLDFLTNGYVNIKIDQTNDIMCKSIEFFPRVMYFSSAYIMVVMSIDRFLVITRNGKFPAPNLYVRSAKLICVGICLIGILLFSPLLWYYNIDNKAYENRHFLNVSCKLKNSMFSELFLYFQSLLVFVLPIVIVVICNIFIVGRLVKRRKLRKRLSSASSINKDPNSGSMKLIGYLAISSGFLLISFPLAITVIVRSIVTGPFQEDKSVVTLTISETSKLTSSVKDIHYAMNFYLNLAFLDRFRSDVNILFNCSHRNKDNNNSVMRRLTKSES